MCYLPRFPPFRGLAALRSASLAFSTCRFAIMLRSKALSRRRAAVEMFVATVICSPFHDEKKKDYRIGGVVDL
jgi:hypothetical protein